jgi:hypothetical protein
MAITTIGKLLGIRPIGMAAIAVFAGGGLALAASSASSAPATPHHPAHPAAGAASEHAGGPHPSMHGLCHAYQAGVANGHGKKLSNPAFSVLVHKAGGKPGLGGYCHGLIGARTVHNDADDRGETGPNAHARSKHVPPGLAKRHH